MAARVADGSVEGIKGVMRLFEERGAKARECTMRFVCSGGLEMGDGGGVLGYCRRARGMTCGDWWGRSGAQLGREDELRSMEEHLGWGRQHGEYYWMCFGDAFGVRTEVCAQS